MDPYNYSIGSRVELHQSSNGMFALTRKDSNDDFYVDEIFASAEDLARFISPDVGSNHPSQPLMSADEAAQAVINLFNHNQRVERPINVVKMIRTLSGCSLIEAKRAYEMHVYPHNDRINAKDKTEDEQLKEAGFTKIEGEFNSLGDLLSAVFAQMGIEEDTDEEKDKPVITNGDTCGCISCRMRRGDEILGL